MLDKSRAERDRPDHKARAARTVSAFAVYRQQVRDHLDRYLRILERQHQAIQTDDMDTLEFYLREGRETLAELQAVQAVVYAREKDSGDEELPQEREAVQSLMERVRRQHRANRDLLVQHRDALGERISDIRVPAQARSVFQPATHGGNMIDMSM